MMQVLVSSGTPFLIGMGGFLTVGLMPALLVLALYRRRKRAGSVMRVTAGQSEGAALVDPPAGLGESKWWLN